MTEKVLGIKADFEISEAGNLVDITKESLVPVVSLEWLEKEIERLKKEHFDEAFDTDMPVCGCVIEGEDGCEVVERLDDLLSA